MQRNELALIQVDSFSNRMNLDFEWFHLKENGYKPDSSF